MKICNKLVRDNIPDICRKNGQIPKISILDEESYGRELKKKLVEEVNEFLESGDTEELADIAEVIDALSEYGGASFEKVIELKTKKQNQTANLKIEYF